jgi:hypothetical protein
MREPATRPRQHLLARRHRRFAAAVAALAIALAGAACGEDEQPPPPPELATEIGKTLAERANEVAEQLEDGRRCAAADEARELRDVAERQVSNDRVPDELSEPLLTGVDALVGRIDCVKKVTETVTIPAEPTTITTTTAPDQDTTEGDGGTESPSEGQGSGSDGGGEPPPEEPPPEEPPPDEGGGGEEGE